VRSGISWWALTEILHVEPHPGPHGVERLNVNQVRRLSLWLVRRGLVRSRSTLQPKQLIFLCPLARRDQLARNKPDSGTHVNPTEQKRALSEGKRRRPRPQPDRDRGSNPTDIRIPGIPSNNSSALGKRGGATRRRGAAAGKKPKPEKQTAAAALIYPAKLSGPGQRAAVLLLKNSPHGDVTEQELLDEVHGIMQTRGARNPLALLKYLADQAAAGTFIPSHADRVAAERELLAVQRATGEQWPASTLK